MFAGMTYAAAMPNAGRTPRHDGTPPSVMDEDRVVAAPRPQRLVSVDVLRGLTIAFMILVNNQPGPDAFSPLKHAAWNGFTPTDLVFPTFLLLVGLSLVLSTASRLARGVGRGVLFLQMLRRSFVLCLLGLVVNTFPFRHLDQVRYYGVLQRTGLCYLAAGAVCVFWPGWKNKVVLLAACLAGYWALMRFVPVPGFGVPTHTVSINHPDGNLTACIDRFLFAPQHLYQRVRDPEGLLSTLPSIATTLLGVLTGLWLRTARPVAQKMTGIAAAGLGCVLTGALWNLSFPINKKLWTSSFVLFAGGWSLLLLALAIYIVEVKQIGRRASPGNVAADAPLLYVPLLVFGTNSILAYMVSELLPPVLDFLRLPSGPLPRACLQWLSLLAPMHGVPPLLFGLSFVVCTWLIVFPLYRRRIFLRI